MRFEHRLRNQSSSIGSLGAGIVILAPVAAKLATDSKVLIGFAAAVGIPLLAWAVRANLSPAFARLAAHPMTPFVGLYATAAGAGAIVAIARGNQPSLLLGQLLPPLLVLAGFMGCSTFLRGLGNRRLALSMTGATFILSLPSLVPPVRWLVTGSDVPYVRFLGDAALLCPIAAILVVTFVTPRAPRLAFALATLLTGMLVLSFTRSYWLGALVAAAILIAGLLAARRGPVRFVFVSGRQLAVVGAVALVVGAGAAVSPIGSAVRDRLHGAAGSYIDTAIPVREFEWRAAWETIKQDPIVGVGAGGQYRSLYQVNSEQLAFGNTNFIHNVGLYFPLKFGLLGWATLASLMVGFAVLVVQALRLAWRFGDIGRLTWTSAFSVVVAASLTAPNLVDPIYAALVGMLARFAADPPDAALDRAASARIVKAPATRIAAIAVTVGSIIAAAIAANLNLGAGTHGARSNLITLAEAQSKSAPVMLSGSEISAAGRNTPEATVLRWWEAVQFGLPARPTLAYVAPAAQDSPDAFQQKLRHVSWYFIENKPRIFGSEVSGNRAKVFAVVGHDALTPRTRKPDALYAFRLTRTNSRWLLANLDLVNDLYRATISARKARSSG